MPNNTESRPRQQSLSAFIGYTVLVVALEFIAYDLVISASHGILIARKVAALLLSICLTFHVAQALATLQTFGLITVIQSTQLKNPATHRVGSSRIHRTAPTTGTTRALQHGGARHRTVSQEQSASAISALHDDNASQSQQITTPSTQNTSYMNQEVTEAPLPSPVMQSPTNVPESPLFLARQNFPPNAKRFDTFEHTFKAPLHAVAHALFHKYTPPNDEFNPGVSSVRWLQDELQAEHDILLRKREVIIDLTFLPYLVRRSLSDSALHVHEHYEWHRRLGILHSHAVNTTLLGTGEFQEVAVYQTHPDNNEWTLYQSNVEINTSGWLGRQILGFVPNEAKVLLAGHVDCITARSTAAAKPNDTTTHGSTNN